MQNRSHILRILCCALALFAFIPACGNENVAPSLLDSFPDPDQDVVTPAPPAEAVLVQFTNLAKSGDLDALALVLQQVFAAGGFEELVDALSLVLSTERVDELSSILNSIIDRGTVFQFTPIASDLLVTLAADRDPAEPGIQSSYDILTQLFETGALTELIVPLRNLLAPEFPGDNPNVADPRIEVIGIQLEILDRLGEQGLQDMLDQLNLGVIPFSEILSPRQAYLLRGHNGSVAVFTAISGTRIDTAQGMAPLVPLYSPESAFVRLSVPLIPEFAGAPCTYDPDPASSYQRSFKALFVTGANAGQMHNIARIDGVNQLSICESAYDEVQEFQVRIERPVPNADYDVVINATTAGYNSDPTPTLDEIAGGVAAAISGSGEPVTAVNLGNGVVRISGTTPSVAFTAALVDGTNMSLVPTNEILVEDDASFRFNVQAVVSTRDNMGNIVRNNVAPVGAAFHASHSGVSGTDTDFVQGRIQAGDQVRVVSGVNSGLEFTVSVGADETLGADSPLYGDVVYLGPFASSGQPYRGVDLTGDADYLIAERSDPTLAFQLTDLNLVRDVVPILERVVSRSVTPDSETLVELMLLVDLIPGSEFQGDDFVSSLEAVLLSSVRTDRNLDGLFDAVDNLDRNGDGGCRNPSTARYVFWEEGIDPLCATDFVDVNNDGVVQQGETFDVNNDGRFDVVDLSREALLDTDNCDRAKFFDRERIVTQGAGACPPGNGFVDCDLFSSPIDCRPFDTNNDGKVDSFDLIPAVLDRAGRVTLANGFSISDRYPDAAPDGIIDWRDIMNSRSVTPSSFVNPSDANPFTDNDNLDRFSQALGNTSLDLFRSDAGPSMRRGAEALIFALDNPANLFIDGRSLPLVGLEDLGRLLTTTDLNTGEFIFGPALRTIYSLMTDGPKAFDGIHGSYEPRYLPEIQGNTVRARFAQDGSSAYRSLLPLQVFLEPLTSVGNFGGPEEFPYGAMELFFKHIFAELQCSDPSVTPSECGAPLGAQCFDSMGMQVSCDSQAATTCFGPGGFQVQCSSFNHLISGIEIDPAGTINISLIQYLSANDDRPFQPVSEFHPFDPHQPLARALPVQACPGGVCSDSNFFNTVVNNTSGGDIDNIFRFRDDSQFAGHASDLREAVPGDFIVISDRPFEAAGVACDSPEFSPRIAQPELDGQGMPVSAIVNCDQFQLFDYPRNTNAFVVEDVSSATSYTLTIDGENFTVTSDADATATEISAALAACVNDPMASCDVPLPVEQPVIATDGRGMVSIVDATLDATVLNGALELTPDTLDIENLLEIFVQSATAGDYEVMIGTESFLYTAGIGESRSMVASGIAAAINANSAFGLVATPVNDLVQVELTPAVVTSGAGLDPTSKVYTDRQIQIDLNDTALVEGIAARDELEIICRRTEIICLRILQILRRDTVLVGLDTVFEDDANANGLTDTRSVLVAIDGAADETSYRITVNGVDFTYTSDVSATETEIARGLVQTINDGAEPVVASVSGNGVFIRALGPGIALSVTTGSGLSESVTPQEDDLPFTVTPGDLSAIFTQGRYYGFLANYLERFPRQVFQLYQYHQIDGSIPTLDGLEPNFDFSNVNLALGVANSPPEFRPSIANQLTQMLPIIDVTSDVVIQDLDDIRALDLSSLAPSSAQLMCPAGTVPLLSCDARFLTDSNRGVNQGLPNDLFQFTDPQGGTARLDIPKVFDDRVICVPASLPSSGQADALPDSIEETVLLNGYDPAGDPCRIDPFDGGCVAGSAFPLPGSTEVTLCTQNENTGPPATGVTITAAMPGNDSTVTVNGMPITYTAQIGDTPALIAGNLVTAINGSGAGARAEVDVDVPERIRVYANPPREDLSVAVSGDAVETRKSIRVTVTQAVAATNYTVNINGTPHSYMAMGGDTPALIATALLMPLGASVEPIQAMIDPLDPATVIITSMPGTLSFTSSVMGNLALDDDCVAGPTGSCAGFYEIRREANALARLIPTVAGINPKTAEQLIDDTRSLTGPLLANGVLSEDDEQAVIESLDAVAAAAKTGFVPAFSRIAQIISRPNIENVDVQTAAIDLTRVLNDTVQLDNGEIINNRVALREIEPVIAAFFSPDTRFAQDLIKLLLALESIPVNTVENFVRVEQPELGVACDPDFSTIGACENRNNGPDLTADFLRAITKPAPLTDLDGVVKLDADGEPIPIRPIDSLTISTDDFLSLAVDCIFGIDESGNGTPIFNCTSPDNPSELTLFGEVTRDIVVILGQVLQSPDFSSELVPFFASILRTVVDLLEPQRGNRAENPTLSALRLFLNDSSLEAARQFTDAFESLNQSDRAKLVNFVVDQFDPDTGAIAGLIEATDPIMRNDADGVFAAAISELLSVNPSLPPIGCSEAQSIAGRVVGCSTQVLGDIPEEDIRFLFDTYVDLVDTGTAEVIVNIVAQLVTTGALERLTPTLLLMSQEGVLNEFILFQALIFENGVLGLEQ